MSIQQLLAAMTVQDAKLVFIYDNGKQFTARNVIDDSVAVGELAKGNQPVVVYTQTKSLPTAKFNEAFPKYESGEFKPVYLGQGVKGEIITYFEDSETGQTEYDIFIEVNTNVSALKYVIAVTYGGAPGITLLNPHNKNIDPSFIADILSIHA